MHREPAYRHGATVVSIGLALLCAACGAAAPQVQGAAARRLLEELIGPALVQWREILEHGDTPPAVRLAAVRDNQPRSGRISLVFSPRTADST